MEGYIHEPTHYYYLVKYSKEGIELQQERYTHLSQATKEAKKLQTPVTIFNSDRVAVHEIVIHNFYF